MGLLIRFVMTVVGGFTAVYVVVATVSVLVGFMQFLIAAPGAIRQDIERWREANAGPPRMIKYVRNEAEDIGEWGRPRALPPSDESG
jgi:hypothetical protein